MSAKVAAAARRASPAKTGEAVRRSMVLLVKDEAHVLEDVGGGSGFELACGRSHRFGKFAPYFVGMGPPGSTTCFGNHRYELHALCLLSVDSKEKGGCVQSGVVFSG